MANAISYATGPRLRHVLKADVDAAARLGDRDARLERGVLEVDVGVKGQLAGRVVPGPGPADPPAAHRDGALDRQLDILELCVELGDEHRAEIGRQSLRVEIDRDVVVDGQRPCAPLAGEAPGPRRALDRHIADVAPAFAKVDAAVKRQRNVHAAANDGHRLGVQRPGRIPVVKALFDDGRQRHVRIEQAARPMLVVEGQHSLRKVGTGRSIAPGPIPAVRPARRGGASRDPCRRRAAPRAWRAPRPALARPW